MIQSMTGFAERFFNTKAFSLKITIKSLNHRFLDWNFRGQKLGELENRLRTLCQENISRGRIEIFLDTDFAGDRSARVRCRNNREHNPCPFFTPDEFYNLVERPVQNVDGFSGPLGDRDDFVTRLETLVAVGGPARNDLHDLRGAVFGTQ